MSTQKKEYDRGGIYKVGQIIFNKGDKFKVLGCGKKINTIEIINIKNKKIFIVKGNIRQQ